MVPEFSLVIQTSPRVVQYFGVFLRIKIGSRLSRCLDVDGLWKFMCRDWCKDFCRDF